MNNIPSLRPIPVIRCTKCGKILTPIPSDNRCPECGKKIRGENRAGYFKA